MTVEGVQAAEVSVGLRLSCRAGWDFAAAKPYLEEAIAGYFKELAESWADEEEPLVVRISGIESRVLALAGILDVTGTVLNSSEGNLTLPPDSIPLLSEVSEWIGRLIDYLPGLLRQYREFQAVCRMEQPMTPSQWLRAWTTSSASFTSTRRTAKPSICSFCPMS